MKQRISFSKNRGFKTIPVFKAITVLVFLLQVQVQATFAQYPDFRDLLNLGIGQGADQYPQIAVSSNYLYVLSSNAPVDGNQVWLRRSTDNGSSFESPSILGTGFHHQVAAKEGYVYVLWSNLNNELFFQRSTDYGATFEATISLSQTDDRLPCIAVEGNNIYAIWRSQTGNDLFFRRSTDYGGSFEPAVVLSNSASDFAEIAATGNYAYLVWCDNSSGNLEVFFRRSTDNGASFGPPVNLSNSASDSTEPQICFSGNNVYVTWTENWPAYQISFSRSTDNGGAFDPVINLSETLVSCANPQIAASGDYVHVVWQERSLLSVYYRRSTNNGAGFEPLFDISDSPGHNYDAYPKVAASGNNAFISWLSLVNAPTSSDYDIYLKASTNNGADFDSPTIINEQVQWAEEIQMAAADSSVYIVWEGGDPGVPDIYFRAGTGFLVNLKETPETGQKNISIFPNPTSRYLYIDGTSSQWNPCIIKIYNSQGQVLLEQKIFLVPGEPVQLELPVLKSGIYFVSIGKEGEKVFSRKIVIR